MLTILLAHGGRLSGIHDLLGSWSTIVVVGIGLVGAMWAYRRGSRRHRFPHDPWRPRCFWLGAAAVAVALLSPLDPLAAELASAHMVQHVVLILVAAPLLAYSAPVTTLLIGAPRFVRRRAGQMMRRLRAVHAGVEALRSPGAAWLLHAATLWFWHASVPYDLALEHPVIHGVEHATFLGTGVLFWSTLLRRRGSRSTSYGYGVLLVFTMAMQSVLLAALLTFARTPWYDGYRDTTQAWGLEPLADQQLAGAIMWVPAGLFYVGAGVAFVAMWIRGSAHAGGGVDDDWTVAGGDTTRSIASSAGRDEVRRAGDVHRHHHVALDCDAP